MDRENEQDQASAAGTTPTALVIVWNRFDAIVLAKDEAHADLINDLLTAEANPPPHPEDYRFGEDLALDDRVRGALEPHERDQARLTAMIAENVRPLTDEDTTLSGFTQEGDLPADPEQPIMIPVDEATVEGTDAYFMSGRAKEQELTRLRDLLIASNNRLETVTRDKHEANRALLQREQALGKANQALRVEQDAHRVTKHELQEAEARVVMARQDREDQKKLADDRLAEVQNLAKRLDEMERLLEQRFQQLKDLGAETEKFKAEGSRSIERALAERDEAKVALERSASLYAGAQQDLANQEKGAAELKAQRDEARATADRLRSALYRLANEADMASHAPLITNEAGHAG